jgi:hypothetical protein
VQGIPMGFSFQFYGNNYTTVGISSNGFLRFGGGSVSTCCGGQCLPNSSFYNSILPFWDDLYSRSQCPGADIYYKTVGVAPHRMFIVQWKSLQYCCSCDGSNLNFEAILYEGSNNIMFQYNSMTGGSEPGRAARAQGNHATIGIEDATGAAYLQYSCTSPTISQGLAILFYRYLPRLRVACSVGRASLSRTSNQFSCTPSGGIPPYTFLWTFGDGSTSTAQNPTHNYMRPGRYSVRVTVTDIAGQTATCTGQKVVFLPYLRR